MKNIIKSIFAALTTLVVNVHLSASAVQLDVQDGLATFLADITGDVQKVGPGTLVLSGTNNLSSLDITEGTISIFDSTNIDALRVGIPITISSTGILLLQEGDSFTNMTTTSTTLFFGGNAPITQGEIIFGPYGTLPRGTNSISGTAVLVLASYGVAGAISSPVNFTDFAKLIIPANVTAGSITGPVTFANGTTIELAENATDTEILGIGGSFAFRNGLKLTLGENSRWTSDVTVTS